MSAADRARSALVDGLLAAGRIRSPAVEEALRAVPRHLFLPGVALPTAYADDAVAVQHVDGVATSSASQPSMVAIMLEQLDLRPGQRVLEIGAGTGWNAALMARIVGPDGSIVSIDIDADLVAGARRHLATAGATGVELITADGALGHPPNAPYDRIVLTVGSSDVRPEWIAQLAPGGRLLLPLALRGSQLSVALDLGPDGVLRSDSVHGCGFIRLRGIGTSERCGVDLPGGERLDLPDDAPPVDAAALAAARHTSADPLTSAVRLGAQDLFDGFGLWLALTERGASWLAAPVDGRVELALVTAAGEPAAGVATVTAAGTRRDSPDRRSAVVVRPFGPAGPDLARRLHAALDGWAAAGAPCGRDWRLVVVPAGGPEPPRGDTVVRLPHATVVCEV